MKEKMMKERFGRFLTTLEVQKIYEAQIEIMAGIGVKIEHEKALQLLSDSGASVDHEKKIAKIPQSLVEKCLARVPGKVVYGGRVKEQDRVLIPDQAIPYTRTVSGADMIVDPETGDVRKSSIKDVENWIRLVDALDFDFVTSIYPDPDEVPVKIRDIQIASIAFQNTTKPFVIGPYNENSLKYMIEMGLAIRGSKEKFKKRPPFSILIASISPLQLPKNQVEMIFMGCEAGVPLELMPMPMAGISAPATIPGVVIISGVEALTMNVIAQLITPDTPVVFSPRTTYLDMAVGVYAVGLEYGMISAVQAQMAREKYGMSSNVFGPHTTSAVNDNQAMIESVLCSIFPVFSGATVVGGAGSIEGGITADPAHVVIADEILKMEIKAMKGIEVNDDTIGMDVIQQVGIGKDYLSTQHTLKFFKSSFYRNTLFDLRYRDSWMEDGSKDMNMRAREKVLAVMRTYKPTPLDEPILRDLKMIVKSAEHELN